MSDWPGRIIAAFATVVSIGIAILWVALITQAITSPR